MSARDDVHVDEDLRQYFDTFINKRSSSQPKTLPEFWEIEWKYISKNKLIAHLPITDKVRQPYGRLHGGASVAFAETLASTGAMLWANMEKEAAVGLEINANHVRPVGDGIVIGTATPVHIGSKTHVWNIEIRNEEGKLVCISRCTVSIISIHASQPQGRNIYSKL